ncbi:MAG: rhomboid family intramembrane serine protease [Gemmatimonadales bacterium]|nr:rhomboid family intramembrane serine protease [Gemmatimonadales bacterium]
MNLTSSNRITPWVGRLIIANAVVLLIMRTIFTPAAADALMFSPSAALSRPWTFFSYMFVHGGLLHLIFNMLMLFVFGSPVESRMGSRAFILYYLYCGVGAAVFALGLSSIMDVSPFVGASGAVLGVVLAFAMFWPDAELVIFPIPIPMRARTFVMVVLGLDVLGALYFNDGIAHLAHVGGVAFGYLFFRMQAFSRRSPHPPPRAVERVVMVQSGAAEPEQHTPVTPIRPRRRIESDPVAAEVDRVLDKISEKGISSLTAAERHFLDEVSKQKKQEH